MVRFVNCTVDQGIYIYLMHIYTHATGTAPMTTLNTVHHKPPLILFSPPHSDPTGFPLSKRSQYGLKWYTNGASTASVYSRLSPSYARAYGPFSLW